MKSNASASKNKIKFKVMAIILLASISSISSMASETERVAEEDTDSNKYYLESDYDESEYLAEEHYTEVGYTEVYGALGVLKVYTEKEALREKVHSKSNWGYSDFMCSMGEQENVRDIVNFAMNLERETGINALFIASAEIHETGWATKVTRGKEEFISRANFYRKMGEDSIENICGMSDEWIDGTVKIMSQLSERITEVKRGH